VDGFRIQPLPLYPNNPHFENFIERSQKSTNNKAYTLLYAAEKA